MALQWPLTDVAPPPLPQLALALSIIKTKPPTLGIREFVLSLRRQVKNGRDVQITDDLDKRVDSITFWRQAYEKSEAAQAKQLDRIYDLEQENASLRMKRDCGGNNVFSDATPEKKAYGNGLGKRKVTLIAGASTCKGSQTPSKRTKTMCNQPMPSSFGTRISLANSVSLNVSYSPSYTLAAPLLRHFCALQRSLQQRKSTATSIANSCIALSQAAIQAATAAVDAVKPAENHPPQLLEVLSGVANCYPSIIKGMSKVKSIENGDIPVSRTITYYIVDLFRSILNQMERYVLLSASAAVQKEHAGDKKRKNPRSRTAKTRAFTATLPSPQVQSTIECFTQLISGLISSTNGLEPCINPFEGFLFYLLHFSGRILSQFTFQELQTDPALRIDSNKLPCPAIAPDLQTNGGEIALAADWTAKHTIWLLNHALSLANEHSALSACGAASGLLNHGKLKLQKTLLQAVFGAAGDDFTNGLTVPEKPTFKGQSISDENGEMSEWFTQELWKLVGWDVLSKANLI